MDTIPWAELIEILLPIILESITNTSRENAKKMIQRGGPVAAWACWKAASRVGLKGREKRDAVREMLEVCRSLSDEDIELLLNDAEGSK